MASVEPLRYFLETDPDLGESYFLFGILCRTAPEAVFQALLELKTERIKGREEQTNEPPKQG